MFFLRSSGLVILHTPSSTFSFILLPIESFLSLYHTKNVHGCRAWVVSQRLRPWRNLTPSLPQQSSTANNSLDSPARGGTSWAPPLSMMVFWLDWSSPRSCTYNYSHRAHMCSCVVMSGKHRFPVGVYHLWIFLSPLPWWSWALWEAGMIWNRKG